MADFSPNTKIVPRAIVLQVLEDGVVDVRHATLIWDAVLPSGTVLQQHSAIDDLILGDIDPAGPTPSVVDGSVSVVAPATGQEIVRKLLWAAVDGVQVREGLVETPILAGRGAALVIERQAKELEELKAKKTRRKKT